MAIIAWKNDYSVKVREWDNHHRIIIYTINELHEAMSAGKRKEALEGILNNLTNYTDYHFAAEEKEMLKHNYPDYTEHRYKHQEMLSNVRALTEDYKQGKKNLSKEVLNFLSNWLNKHIAGTDKRYSSFMNSVGVN
jgi:hemerythrin